VLRELGDERLQEALRAVVELLGEAVVDPRVDMRSSTSSFG